MSFSRIVTLWSNSCPWAQYRSTWVRLNDCDEEKVRPDDQWSFLRIEIKKKLLLLAGFNLWSNYTMGKYSWVLCKSPSILKHPPPHPPEMTAPHLGESQGQKLSQRKQLWILQNSQSYCFAPQDFSTCGPQHPRSSREDPASLRDERE